MSKTTCRPCASSRTKPSAGRGRRRGRHSLDLSNSRYKGGVASYLEVTTAQSAALADERAAVDVLTRRMAASVLLVKALGGGWGVSQLPSM